MNHLELISIAGKDRTGQLYRRAAYKLNVLTTVLGAATYISLYMVYIMTDMLDIT